MPEESGYQLISRLKNQLHSVDVFLTNLNSYDDADGLKQTLTCFLELVNNPENPGLSDEDFQKIMTHRIQEAHNDGWESAPSGAADFLANQYNIPNFGRIAKIIALAWGFMPTEEEIKMITKKGGN